MNSIAYLDALQNGDVTLVSSDGSEVRVFRNVLILAEYFKGSQQFAGAKNSRFEFDQFTAANLADFVKYLYGLSVTITDELITMLDYFQAPILLDFNLSHFTSLSPRSIMLGVRRKLDYEEIEVVYERLLKEKLYDDKEFRKWVDAHGNPEEVDSQLIVKLHAVEGLMEKDWEGVRQALYQLDDDDLIDICRECRYVPASLVGQYYTWLLETARSE